MGEIRPQWLKSYETFWLREHEHKSSPSPQSLLIYHLRKEGTENISERLRNISLCKCVESFSNYYLSLIFFKLIN